MSAAQAAAFLERVEGDGKLAADLDALKDDPPALLARVRDEGFDADPAEIRAAFVHRYGDQLSPEQLDTLAAGVDAEDVALIAGGAVMGGSVAAAVLAAVVAF
jgi:predicted ribosomally synthesized peptide with nif11-like leader